jgi:GAF domain-containing protein
VRSAVPRLSISNFFTRYYQPSNLPIDPTKAPEAAHGSHDLALTAFAQLGALRLNAKRSVISLVGKDTEYVIAEAGRTLSLQDDSRHDEGDHLWHGVGALQSKAAVGLIVMNHLSGVSQPAIPYLIINDLSKDEQFKRLPIVTEVPFARFLACLPLRTAAGFVIGMSVHYSHCVVLTLEEAFTL